MPARGNASNRSGALVVVCCHDSDDRLRRHPDTGHVAYNTGQEPLRLVYMFARERSSEIPANFQRTYLLQHPALPREVLGRAALSSVHQAEAAREVEDLGRLFRRLTALDRVKRKEIDESEGVTEIVVESRRPKRDQVGPRRRTVGPRPTGGPGGAIPGDGG
jgi:hypothetical protein